jgi:predicted enzyme related to lactoylglutathione lyase
MADDFHGAVWWSELMTRDPDAALAYYAEVCGWRFDSMEMEGSDSPYHVAMRGDRPVAGIMDMTAMPELDEAPAH